MSGANSGKALTAWTDKERLVYLFALIEKSNVTFDYNNTPRPAGRSVIACQRMMGRLKDTLKNELEALMSGNPIEEDTPKKTPTPRKRKAKGEAAADGEGEVTPAKRGRKKKVSEDVVGDEEEEVTPVKPEPKEEDLEEDI
ncbi:hypothetical protein J4E83_009489 [Alternaria metachromatica]|uniref:uncharacterized protein n=1 Tax=Alternaria metachromatica TaxID=283354 RepID=UPI0020C3D276|nr:uncharacterized protein J4E83_009489 [Alternaria metachromatica]XP_051327645.1 uncharacterized protein J4E85_003787 [Alternaria conjuncta]KAI4607592.1 hypothetical protein J4E83_009489 [Alternaria metachromatica]KAI4931198.1 hypothetical protein J4E85_003787 [Alternaria conjuncta]